MLYESLPLKRLPVGGLSAIEYNKECTNKTDMQISTLDNPSADAKTFTSSKQQLSLTGIMKAVFHKRVFPGFKIGEAAMWFLFHISWPLLLATIFQISGKFKDPAYMTLSDFIRIQSFVIAGKAIFLVPFWWLFFIKLKNTSLTKKIGIHVFTSLLYIAMCITTFYFILTGILGREYSPAAMLSDVYNLMLTYFSHFALFHAYNFWLHTKQQMQKEQELKELAYQSEIMALKAQIEPHFLFNTLNSISASVPASLEKTRILIAQLADTFRYALRVSERQTVSLQEEIDFVKTWLALEKHRFGNRLMIEYCIDNSALSVQIPSLVLQPLIENAIKHGISPNVEGGTVSVVCRREDNFIHFKICDTGIGYSSDLDSMFTKGVGLKNTTKRLEHLYNEKLVVERREPGLCFSFKLPAQ